MIALLPTVDTRVAPGRANIPLFHAADLENSRKKCYDFNKL
jgi:hypothetical protein